MIELPYSVVEPQLASGRVAIDPKLFHRSIPEKLPKTCSWSMPRKTQVLLPLQGSACNIFPATALEMRHDQEQEEAVNYFDTPIFEAGSGRPGKVPEPQCPAHGGFVCWRTGSRETPHQPKSAEAPVSQPVEPEKPGGPSGREANGTPGVTATGLPSPDNKPGSPAVGEKGPLGRGPPATRWNSSSKASCLPRRSGLFHRFFCRRF